MAQNVRFGNPINAVNLKKKTELQGNEYGKAGKGVIVCEVCHNVFFKKVWHQPGSAPLTGTKLSGTGVHFALCPACKMKKGNLYGGKVTIKNIPTETREELFNLISGFGRRALERNPQDRIMNIKTTGGTFLITTNNDELAAKLGKRITDTFKKTEKKVSFSSEPEEVSHVEINFVM
jgi:hypothetical protein